jgi:hypothetical protein
MRSWRSWVRCSGVTRQLGFERVIVLKAEMAEKQARSIAPRWASAADQRAAAARSGRPVTSSTASGMS